MEDYILYFILAAVLGIVTALLSVIFKSKGDKKPEEPDPARNQQVGGRGGRNVPQRRVAVRNRRLRNAEDSDDEDAEPARVQPADVGDSDEELESKLNDPKLGAKKREKLLLKAEKKSQREAEERAREDKKQRELKKEEERKKAEEQEAEQERQRIEEEKRLKEEQAQRELEEYEKMKSLFTVEDGGFDVADADEEENLLDKFVEHIKAKKVILFEELATQFNLKVPEAIDRLTQLVSNGRVTGVMDDRGKFIYISTDELSKFAKFVKQRGRVSIAEIVENSTSIINITPDNEITAQ